MRRIASLLVLAACGGGLDLDVQTVEEIARVCRRAGPDASTIRVEFEAVPPGCAWGQDDNLGPWNGVVTARNEQYQTLDIPDDALVCGMSFDFQIDPDEEPVMEYDDNMFLLYNGVVLAASYLPFIDVLPREDELPVWDWMALRGTRFDFQDRGTYCLGQETGQSNCVIPPPETRGSLLLDYDAEVIDSLSLRSVQLGKHEFGFVTIGDNDWQLDCRHEAFAFDVEVPYIEN